MKKVIILLFCAISVIACGSNDEPLRQRTVQLCNYIPDHRLIDGSKDYLTADFYFLLDTLFRVVLDEDNYSELDWLYYFVTGNGGSVPEYKVRDVILIDSTHAIARILVRQRWDDGTYDEGSGTVEHLMAMQQVDGKWLISDFDGHKQDCINYLYRR